MKKLTMRFCICSLILIGMWLRSVQASDASRLWYEQPAGQWVEALPLGNGRLGAMVFGGIDEEHLQINEDSVWVGKPHDYSHPGAFDVLDDLRQLLFTGQQSQAEDLAMDSFMSIPLRQMAYQKFVDLRLAFPHDPLSVVDYRRELDLNTATATVSYRIGAVTYTRQVFASYPDQVLIIRISADQSGAVGFTASLQTGHSNGTHHILASNRIAVRDYVQSDGIHYEAQMLVKTDDGNVFEQNGDIVVQNSTSVTILISGATNFVNFQDISGDHTARNNTILAAAEPKTFDQLLQTHIQDYQSLFQRVQIDLGGGASANLPTDQRITQFAQTEDPQMLTLLYQFGRYLLIACSRAGSAGGQPANLQGLWNDDNTPQWESKYTVNINTEMNYWPVEPTRLTECFQPLVCALQDLSVSGATVAQVHYNAPGWVLHHNFDLWRGAAPINNSNHGICPTGGAWLCQHLWQHYLYTGDKTFLQDTAYPLMKASALFHLNTLVKHPTMGFLISGPSNSPEHGGLVMGPTMDHQIIRSLFLSVVAASEILGVDTGLRDTLNATIPQIASNEIGSVGQLKEWVDKEDPYTTHRHVSHLWGLHPGAEITPLGTPDLAEACKKTLELRGDGGTGWSIAWKINFWARLWDGNHSFLLAKNLFATGLYPNLFDKHPPFQIDGNFGFVSGVTEWFLQSHDPNGQPGVLNDVFAGKKGYIHLLPALPDKVAEGHISGLCATGGFIVDIDWSNGGLDSANILSVNGNPLTVRYDGQKISFNTAPGQTYHLTNTLTLCLYDDTDDPIERFDHNNDCIINLLDIALFSERYLDHNCIPAEHCQ